MAYYNQSINDLSRVVNIYLSRQFATYICCGLISTTVQLATRYCLSFWLDFSLAVVVSYIAGLLVALFLYRRFVFAARSRALSQQAVLFSAAYLAFLPVTWGLSVATVAPLLHVMSPDLAHLTAHTIGVGVPVVLNFAFNKLVTFRDGPRSVTERMTVAAAFRDQLPRLAVVVLVLVSVYVGVVAFIGASGDFPLNDDWAYATTTRAFSRTGVFTPSSWSSIPLLTQVLVALPVCAATACGSDDLRLVTLLAAMLLFAATVVLVAGKRPTMGLPLLAGAVVAFNPVVLTLAFTFMSDTLFAALMTVGAILFMRSIERNSTPLAVLGTATAIAATLTRQLGLCLPLAFLAVACIRMASARSWRRQALPALLPLAACVIALMALKAWLRATGRLPALYDVKSSLLVETLHSPVASLLRVGHNLSVIVTYMGLFTLPMLLATRAPPATSRAGRDRTRSAPRLVAGLVTALAILDLASLHRLMPSGGNVLVPQGVGPLLLRDSAILGTGGVAPLPSTFWVAVTLLGLLGAFLLTERVVAGVQSLFAAPASPEPSWSFDRSRLSILFAAVAALSYVAPLLLIPFYDRYLVPLLPLTLFFLVATSPGAARAYWRSACAASLCGLISAYAVLAVHDYMAWNRARWQAIADLEARPGVGADRIDGGMEYNGLRSYRPDYVVQDGKSWWWVDNDDYQVTFEPVPGREPVAQYAYRTLLPPAWRSIKVLQKAP